ASSKPTVYTAAVAAALTAGGGGEQGGSNGNGGLDLPFSVAGAGAAAVNVVHNITEASTTAGSSLTATAGTVTLTADGGGSVYADAGGVALGVRAGKGSSAVGLSAAVNDVANTVRASADGTTISARGSVSLTATGDPTLRTVAIGGAASPSGPQGNSFAGTPAGPGARNSVHPTHTAP